MIAEFEGSRIVVDISMLPVEIAYPTGALFQFLGDIDVHQEVSLLLLLGIFDQLNAAYVFRFIHGGIC